MSIIKNLFKRNKKEEHLWDKFYPKDKRKVEVPNMSLFEFIYEENKNPIEYWLKQKRHLTHVKHRFHRLLIANSYQSLWGGVIRSMLITYICIQQQITIAGRQQRAPYLLRWLYICRSS